MMGRTKKMEPRKKEAAGNLNFHWKLSRMKIFILGFIRTWERVGEAVWIKSVSIRPSISKVKHVACWPMVF
jgi:hypothetical protein